MDKYIIQDKINFLKILQKIKRQDKKTIKKIKIKQAFSGIRFH